jgi:hypothetical protein
VPSDGGVEFDRPFGVRLRRLACELARSSGGDEVDERPENGEEEDEDEPARLGPTAVVTPTEVAVIFGPRPLSSFLVVLMCVLVI